MLNLVNTWRENRSSPDQGDKGILQRGKIKCKSLNGGKKSLQHMRIHRAARGEQAVAAVKLERMTGRKEDLGAHCKELRLCPQRTLWL